MFFLIHYNYNKRNVNFVFRKNVYFSLNLNVINLYAMPVCFHSVIRIGEF